MLSPNISRENLYVDTGSAGTSTSMWVAGGIAFLFLIFILFGVGAFLNNRHDHSTDIVRERTGLSNADLLAAAQERGAAQVRQSNTMMLVERIADQITALRGEVADVGRENRSATVEAAQGVIDAGRTFGFRSLEVVYPDPCRHRRETVIVDPVLPRA